MPKLKSKGAVKKRFRLTKSGKLKASRAFRGHMHAPKSGEVGRNKRKPLVIEGTWATLLKRMMGAAEMVRVTYGAPRRQKKSRYFKQARGFRGGRSKLWRTVRETLLRSWAYAYRDRRQKKRHFRRLWIIRINAAARMRGMTYFQFNTAGLKGADVSLNRKQLSELAIHDPAAFDALVEEARAARA